MHNPNFIRNAVILFLLYTLVGGIAAYVYSELCVHVYTLDDYGELLSEEELNGRQLLPYQMLAFALTLGVASVVVRVLLDFSCNHMPESSYHVAIATLPPSPVPVAEAAPVAVVAPEPQSQRPAPPPYPGGTPKAPL